MRFLSKIKNTYYRGILAEYIACIYLLCKGYAIETVRYKTKMGEIDIVAKRKGTFVFVEVKLRHNHDAALHAIRDKSKLRIKKAAEHYLLVQKKESDNLFVDCRFDVVAISKFYNITHIHDAF